MKVSELVERPGYGWTYVWLALAVVFYASDKPDIAVWGAIIMSGVLGARTDILLALRAREDGR